MILLTDISENLAYSPPIEPSELSNTSSTDACPTGFLALEPLNMTSVNDSPRRYLGELSPMTQVTASIIFDLPQPFGPTIAMSLLGRLMVVGSTNDLKPAILMLESCMFPSLIKVQAEGLSPMLPNWRLLCQFHVHKFHISSAKLLCIIAFISKIQ